MSASFPNSWEPYGSSQQSQAIAWRKPATRPAPPPTLSTRWKNAHAKVLQNSSFPPPSVPSAAIPSQQPATAPTPLPPPVKSVGLDIASFRQAEFEARILDRFESVRDEVRAVAIVVKELSTAQDQFQAKQALVHKELRDELVSLHGQLVSCKNLIADNQSQPQPNELIKREIESIISPLIRENKEKRESLESLTRSYKKLQEKVDSLRNDLPHDIGKQVSTDISSFFREEFLSDIQPQIRQAMKKTSDMFTSLTDRVTKMNNDEEHDTIRSMERRLYDNTLIRLHGNEADCGGDVSGARNEKDSSSCLSRGDHSSIEERCLVQQTERKSPIRNRLVGDFGPRERRRSLPNESIPVCFDMAIRTNTANGLFPAANHDNEADLEGDRLPLRRSRALCSDKSEPNRIVSAHLPSGEIRPVFVKVRIRPWRQSEPSVKTMRTAAEDERLEESSNSDDNNLFAESKERSSEPCPPSRGTQDSFSSPPTTSSKDALPTARDCVDWLPQNTGVSANESNTKRRYPIRTKVRYVTRSVKRGRKN